MVGGLIGNYRIVSKLATGGMGEVYVAEHRHMGKRAAIKVLLPDLSKRQDVIMRLFDEARAASHIDHPGIVQIFDCDYYAPTGQAYLVMELLQGQTLRQRLVARKGARDELWAARVALGIAEPLAAAHAVGIVHRDLKPENIFLVGEAGQETVKVLDFGVAKLSHSMRGRTTSTLEGNILGTPLYMSPEQCRGERNLDARADIYSLGCVLYEMTCGRPPFVGDTPTALIAAHLCDPIPPPESFTPELSPALTALLRSMLEKEPGRRPPGMQDVVDRLAALRGMDAPGRRVPRVVRTPAIAAVVGGTAPLGVSDTLVAPTPAQSTTLGQTASESVTARPRSRAVTRTALIAIGAGGLVALSAGVYLARRGPVHDAGPGAEVFPPVPAAPAVREADLGPGTKRPLNAGEGRDRAGAGALEEPGTNGATLAGGPGASGAGGASAPKVAREIAGAAPAGPGPRGADRPQKPPRRTGGAATAGAGPHPERGPGRGRGRGPSSSNTNDRLPIE